MVIIDRKDIENSVYFPQNIYTKNNGQYKLVLCDRCTNVNYPFENLEDKHLVEVGFYTFFINFNNLPVGEYEYQIFDSNDNMVGSGLIRLNQLEQTNIIYNDNRNYIVYDKQ